MSSLRGPPCSSGGRSPSSSTTVCIGFSGYARTLGLVDLDVKLRAALKCGACASLEPGAQLRRLLRREVARAVRLQEEEQAGGLLELLHRARGCRERGSGD